jgi:tRNA1Val (adenine37-N6)-methyltransferase
MTFRFRQFEIEDDHSSMRVGTDAMLLGSWIDPGRSRRILDIGTGCGVLALMMAQKSEAEIIGIDIDEDSAGQASENFLASPWKEKLTACNCSFQDYVARELPGFELVLTNPPYFTKSLQSPVGKRNRARHDNHLTKQELLEGVSRVLSLTGKFCLILPAELADPFITDAVKSNLYLNKRLMIIPKPGKDPTRIVMEFSFFHISEIQTDRIIIRNSDGTYTEDYRSFTDEFHSNL